MGYGLFACSVADWLQAVVLNAFLTKQLGASD
jgi:hypothetical protein